MADQAIDPNSATWIVDQVLKDGDAEDIRNAATILFKHAHELAVRTDGGFILYMPERVLHNWDSSWPSEAKTTLVGTLTRVLLSQDPKTWHFSSSIFRTLWKAAEDPDEVTRRTAAATLRSFAPTPEELRPLFGDGPGALEAATKAQLHLRGQGVPPNWFYRTPDAIDEIERWRRGAASWVHSWKPGDGSDRTSDVAG